MSTCQKKSDPEEKGFWSDNEVWKRAAANTTRCLVGCSLGDFAMMFYLQAYHPGLSVGATMAAAMASGVSTSLALETVVLRVTERFSWQRSFSVAWGMSLTSMLAMEAAENITNYGITGGVVDTGNTIWWLALIPSLAAGFLAPLPYNYRQLKKYGKSCH